MRAFALLLLLAGCASKPAAKGGDSLKGAQAMCGFGFRPVFMKEGGFYCIGTNVTHLTPEQTAAFEPPPATHHPPLPTPKPDKAKKRKKPPPTVLGFKICGTAYCVVPIDWSLSCNRGLEHGAEYDVDKSGCVHAMGYLAISTLTNVGPIVQPTPPVATRDDTCIVFNGRENVAVLCEEHFHLSCAQTPVASTDGRIELDCTKLAP